jgi:hypothetical protein
MVKKSTPKFTIKVVYRSSITGRIVTEAYAKANPKTTYKDTIKVPQ